MMDPQQLAQLQRLVKSLRKQLFRHSQQSEVGTYRSKFKGSGLQFREHQVYEPGDDVRFIDWKLTARLNRPYIKTFEEERLVTLHVIVDASSTMMMGEGPLSKAQVALQLCVLLALAAQKTKDKMMVSWVGRDIYQTPLLKGQAIIPHCLDVAAQSGILKQLGEGFTGQKKERKKEAAQRLLAKDALGGQRGSGWLPGFKKTLWGPVLDHQLLKREDVISSLMKVVKEGLAKKREVIVISDFYQLQVSDMQLYLNRKNFHLVRLLTGLDQIKVAPFSFYNPLDQRGQVLVKNEQEQKRWEDSLKHPKIIHCDLRADYLKDFLQRL